MGVLVMCTAKSVPFVSEFFRLSLILQPSKLRRNRLLTACYIRARRESIRTIRYTSSLPDKPLQKPCDTWKPSRTNSVTFSPLTYRHFCGNMKESFENAPRTRHQRIFTMFTKRHFFVYWGFFIDSAGSYRTPCLPSCRARPTTSVYLQRSSPVRLRLSQLRQVRKKATVRVHAERHGQLDHFLFLPVPERGSFSVAP